MTLNYQLMILWRHAEAEMAEYILTSEGEMVLGPDSARELSAKGKNQAKKMAGWLKHKLPKNTLILVSPALRTEQTAHALKQDYQMIKALQPEATLMDVLQVLQEIDTPNLLLIGHQPWLGQLITYLTDVPKFAELSPKQANQIAMASIKKGGLWWFKQANTKTTLTETANSYKVIAVQNPDFL